jgi:tRNA nucleotidyltransferase/poly(A) polymerase
MRGSDENSCAKYVSPYAGRWVARLHGKIIAQGRTAEEAQRVARTCRHKESPEIVYMPSMKAFPFSPILDLVHDCLAPDQEIYLVGGALRDALLGRESQDLDFVVPADGIRLGRRIADTLQADFYPLDEKRDTGRVILSVRDGRRANLDFATYRGSSLDDDLRARDFTINALAFDLRTEQIHDPLNGAQDIRSKTIRACNPESFKDDPVRILRAVRQAVELDFQIDQATRKDMKESVNHLRDVSAERLRDEIFHILERPGADAAFRVLERLGALAQILPELPALKGVEQPKPHQYDVWTHTLAVIRALDDILAVLAPGYDPESTGDLFTGLLAVQLGRYRERFGAHQKGTLASERTQRGLLFFAALFHDVAKPECQTVGEDGRVRFWGHDERGSEIAAARARALHLSNGEIERVRAIIRHHMRLNFHSNRLEGQGMPPSRKAIYRFFRDTGEAGVDLVLLALADTRATRGPALSQENWTAVLDVCRIFLENYWEKPQETVSPPVLLNGYEVMREFGLEPGPQVGLVMEAIREAQATGEVTSREEALTYGRIWLEANP